MNVFSKSILLAVLATCSSCMIGKMSKRNGTGESVFYPAAPDTARIQFLTKISSSIDVTGKKNWFKKFILGRERSMPIIKPHGLTIRNGKIYVCDKKAGGLEIINLEKSTFEYFVPEGKGKLKMPLSCEVDAKGRIYIADAGRCQVVIFNEKRKYVTSFGDSTKFKPTDLFITENKIWVANMTGHKIEVYSLDSIPKFLYSINESEPGEVGYLYSPTHVVVHENKVYVTDFGDFKIKIFTLEGKFLEAFGTYGTSLGQLAKPKGIAVDNDSNLFVVDAAFENVQMFNPQGKLLMFFGGPYKGPGDLWLPTQVKIDYDHLVYFKKFVAQGFNLKYLILVSNQFGPDKINVYGFIEPNKAGASKTNRESSKGRE